MSCPSEYTCSLYCDGELAPAEALVLEQHAAGCAPCRALVAALRVEAELLREVLHAPVVAPAARSLGPLLACGTALGGLALAVDAATAMLAASLPRGFGWFNPLDWIGGKLMFDAIVFAREQAGLLLAQCLDLGVGLSLVVVLALLATGLRRRAPTLALIGLACALLAPAPASAFEMRQSEEVVDVPAGETVSGTLIVASGEGVTVNGVVEGDLIALSGDIQIAGRVTGNVYAVGGEQKIAGEIAGSLIVIGGDIELSGAVGGNLYVAGGDVVLTETARVRDLGMAAGGARLQGAVARDVLCACGSLALTGQVGRNAVIWSNDLSLGPTASVVGDLEIHLGPEGTVAIAPGASIGGEKREVRHVEDEPSRYAWLEDYVLHPLLLGVACLLTGLVFNALAPTLFGDRVSGGGDFARRFGLGLLVLVGGPVSVVLLAITVVGLPLALIGLAAYVTALFLALLAVAALLGNAIWKDAPVDTGVFAKHLATGLAILIAVLHVPYVGGLLRFLVLLLGLGLLAASLYRSWQLRQLAME